MASPASFNFHLVHNWMKLAGRSSYQKFLKVWMKQADHASRACIIHRRASVQASHSQQPSAMEHGSAM
eukprot:1148607-Pelagomonas_calceolata.AAC.1